MLEANRAASTPPTEYSVQSIQSERHRADSPFLRFNTFERRDLIQQDYTLRQIAHLFNYSERQLRRKLASRQIPGAYKLPDGDWRIKYEVVQELRNGALVEGGA